MKKKLFALSGVFLIALVITGLWATKAISFTDESQAIQSDSVATTQAQEMSIEAMAIGSDSIIIGKCLRTRSEWIGRNLFTLATILVADTLKGEAAAEVTVVLPGGVDSNRAIPIGVTHPGAPRIDLEEEVALFLVPAPDEVANGYAVMGFNQGKLSIAIDNEGGKVVTRDPTRALVHKGAGVMRGTRQAIPLPELIERVKTALDK